MFSKNLSDDLLQVDLVLHCEHFLQEKQKPSDLQKKPVLQALFCSLSLRGLLLSFAEALGEKST